MQAEFLRHETRNCSYPCEGNCIGAKVKFRFFCDWSHYKVNLQNDITQPSKEDWPKGQQEDWLRDRDQFWSLVKWAE